MKIHTNNMPFWAICLLFCVFLNACGKRKTFEKYNNLPALTWEQNNISKYTVNLAEAPKEALKMGIGLRIVHSMAHKTVPVQLTIKQKDGKGTPFTKPFQIQIRNEKGQINGGVMGDLADIEQILEDFPFKEKGEYEVEIQHINMTTMDKKLLDVMEVGFFIN